MKEKKTFQIRSKKDAHFLARRIKDSEKTFYYHVPLVGGMEGSLTSIRCDPKSDFCQIFTSIPGILDENRKQGDIADHLWKERKLINAEFRDPESEWRILIPQPG
ncbi:MAG: hypothetical protein M0P57_13960 [Syntrophales bacterium]|jgi:hypothetical protein|nr:hypothetical protein [Syntrophales bacterium]MDY0043857.1 hypothetical protein [Syntrophales bacterium]